MSSRLPRFLLALVMPTFAMACAVESENAAPIIDSVDAPLRVTAKDGAYRIPVSLLFHDNDGEAVTHLRYRLPPSIDGIVDVPAPNPSKESAQLTIVIPVSDLAGDRASDTNVNARGDKRDDDGKTAEAASSSKGRGRRALQITVVDSRGGESLPYAGAVTLD